MPRGAPDEVLKHVTLGERFTVTDLYSRLPHRTQNAVKAYVRKLLQAGVLVVCGTSPTPSRPNRALYCLADNAPDIRSKQAQIVDAIGAEEVVNTSVMRSRFPDWPANVISTALREAARQEKIAVCGSVIDERNGSRQLLYCRRDAAAASRTAYDVSVDETEVRVQAQTVELPPFVALFTPPLPAFRIRSTRHVRPMFGSQREAA